MIVSRRSPLTGKVNEMDIPVTEEQLAAWKGGAMIQDAMPNLSADQREFILTGYTAADWDEVLNKTNLPWATSPHSDPHVPLGALNFWTFHK
jgi:hypothetical protein